MTGEFRSIERIHRLLPPVDPRELGIGDDAAAVVVPAGWLLLATDAVVAGVHADLSLTGLADLGWKAMAANVSDITAMGGQPRHALVAVAGPADTDLEELYRGIAAAARHWSCPVVGGDLSNAPGLVVTVTMTGSVAGAPVRRSGARAGDGIYVTGPLGLSAAGLRQLRSGVRAETPATAAHRRPLPEVAAGQAARLAGATSMIDVSDGLCADIGHLADASGVGVELEHVPVGEGATAQEALVGGEDYVLVFTAADHEAVDAAFAPSLPVWRIGRCTGDASRRRVEGRPWPDHAGWEHGWS